MLRINTPELLIFNPSLVEGLFDQIWTKYLSKQLMPERWDAYRGDFFLDSQTLFYDTFAHCIEEIVAAANLRRPVDFEYVTFDYSSYTDCYNYEGGGNLTPDEEEVVETKMFDFFAFVIDHLINEDFLNTAQLRLQPTWESLTGIIGCHNIRGYWYEGMLGQMNMWEGKGHVWGIQDGDYDTLLYAPWEGANAGTEFYHLCAGDGNDFYLFNGSLIQEHSCDLIPRGEMVTLCRLNDKTMSLMDL